MPKFIRPFYLTGIFAAFFCLGLTGCEVDVNEGPVEEAAEGIDETIDDTGEALEGDNLDADGPIEEAAEDVEDTVDEIGNDLERNSVEVEVE